MPQQVSAIPVGALMERVSFDLAALATRDGVRIDTSDWSGATQANFSDDRKTAWPFLDLAIRPPGNVNVNLQYGVPAFPIVEPPVLAFTTIFVVGVAGGTWGTISGRRIEAQFARIQIEDTSNAANNGIYLSYYVRGN